MLWKFSNSCGKFSNISGTNVISLFVLLGKENSTNNFNLAVHFLSIMSLKWTKAELLSSNLTVNYTSDLLSQWLNTVDSLFRGWLNALRELVVIPVLAAIYLRHCNLNLGWPTEVTYQGFLEGLFRSCLSPYLLGLCCCYVLCELC